MRDDEQDDVGERNRPEARDAQGEPREVERERERDAAQERGRERMLAMWRAAVAAVTEAARREAARGAAATDADPRRAAATRDDDTGDELVTTWAFPPKTRAAS